MVSPNQSGAAREGVPVLLKLTTDQRFTRDITALSQLLADGGRMSDDDLSAAAESYAQSARLALDWASKDGNRSRLTAIWFAGLQAARALYLENLMEDREAFRRDHAERMQAQLSARTGAQ